MTGPEPGPENGPGPAGPESGPGRGPGAAGPGFGVRLEAATAARGPLCVGIDPHPELLDRWGLPDGTEGLERFARTVVDALAAEVALLKPQVAFFERHGAAGLAVLERVLADCRAAGVLTVADAKRGDIGSTAAGYADAWLGEGSPLAADAVTVSPYLGYGSLRPLVTRAAATGRGVFVLALTSNPEGASVQHAAPPRPADAPVTATVATAGSPAPSPPPTVAAAVVAAAAADNAELVPDPADLTDPADPAVSARPGDSAPAGPVGVVVGATLGATAQASGVDLAGLRGHVLAPGVGAQGAGITDARRVLVDVLGADPRHVVPSASREVLRAGPGAAAVREAARRLSDAALAALSR